MKFLILLPLLCQCSSAFLPSLVQRYAVPSVLFSTTDNELHETKLELLQDVVLKIKEQRDKTQENSKKTQNKLEFELQQTQQQLKSQLQTQQATFEKEFQIQRDKLAQFQAKIQALEQERREVEEQTQLHIQSLQREWKKERHQIQLDRDQERSQWQRKLEQARIQAQTDLEDRKKSFDESMEIAKASVASAERREASWKSKYQTLQKEYEELRTQADEWKKELDQYVEKQSIPPNNEISSAREDELLQEIERLEDQMRTLRSTHAAERRIQDRKLQESKAELQADYEERLRKIRKGRIAVPEPTPKGIWQRVKKRIWRQK